MAGPRLVVDPPTFTPSPYGLLSVVDQPGTPDAHWMNGITWKSVCASGANSTTYDECLVVTGGTSPAQAGAPPPPASKTDNVDVTYRGATPFTVMTKFDCSPVGGLETAREDALRALSQTEPYQVENSFWTGISGGQVVAFPHLAANAAVVDQQSIVLQLATVTVTGGATPLHVTEALGLLEGAIARCYNGVGVIHVPQAALPTLDAWGLVHPRGAVLYTANGNRIAAGSGYPGTSPAGAAPAAGSTWLYATGAVSMRRSDIKVLDQPRSAMINRAENTLEMIVERTYVFAYDCCLFGVLTSVSVPV
jgi:hypothetical protein